MATNRQHLHAVNEVSAGELVKVVSIGLLFGLFAYLLWQMFQSASQGIMTLVRSLIPRVV